MAVGQRHNDRAPGELGYIERPLGFGDLDDVGHGASLTEAHLRSHARNGPSTKNNSGATVTV